MSAKTFYFHVRVNTILTDATSVTLTVTQGVTTLINEEEMERISLGTYKFISDDLFSEGVTYTANYVINLGGNTYTVNENFTVEGSTELFTLDELKTQLGITSAEYDSELELVKSATFQLFEEYLNRKIGLTTRTINEYDKEDIFLSATPIDEITSVQVDDTDIDYTLVNGNIGHIRIEEDLEEGDKIVIIYTGGLAINDNIKQAGLYQAAFMYKRHHNKHIHVREQTSNNAKSIYLTDGLLPLVKVLIDPYVIHSI